MITTSHKAIHRIPDEELAEHFYAFMNRMMQTLQSAFVQEQKETGLTQKDIGTRIGKSTASVSRWLSGQTNMTARTLHDLARGIGCRLDVSAKPLRQMKLATSMKTRESAARKAAGTARMDIKGSFESRLPIKLRRERDRLAQRVAERDDEIKRQRELREAAERQASAARGQVTKLKNRASKGVCPCCNRSFDNLRRHMETKHPGLQPAASCAQGRGLTPSVRAAEFKKEKVNEDYRQTR